MTTPCSWIDIALAPAHFRDPAFAAAKAMAADPSILPGMTQHTINGVPVVVLKTPPTTRALPRVDLVSYCPQALALSQTPSLSPSQPQPLRVAHTPLAVHTGGGLVQTGANPPRAVAIATMAKALRQASSEKGYSPSDDLVRLMIGQMIGAEGTMPGLGGTLGGTNNIGAAQVTASLFKAKAGQKNWGAFAHFDSDPNRGAYIGWYWIAPSPLEAARYWLGNWWGGKLLSNAPGDATEYARLLYSGGYFGGVHPGDSSHDPDSDAGQLNVADYASAIARGTPSSIDDSLAQDPSKTTVDPTQFASLTARKITQALFDKAKGGGIGSAWKYLLPANFSVLQKTNGVVWFDPSQMSILSVPAPLKKLAIAVAAGGAVIGGMNAYAYLRAS